jgi:hypothetical protein
MAPDILENSCTHALIIPSRDAMGYAVAQLVEALRYKPEGRGFDSRCCHWNFDVSTSNISVV